MIIFLIMLPLLVGAEPVTIGEVTGSIVNVRSYGEIQDGNRLFQIPLGEEVEIVGVSGDFFRANIRGRENVYIAQEWVRVTKTHGTAIAPATLYDKPYDAGGLPLAILHAGTNVTVRYMYNSWLGIEVLGSLFYVRTVYILMPDYVYTLPTVRFSGSSGMVEYVIARGVALIGTRYRWGGTSPATGFDCSGFIRYITRPASISLYRSSADMSRNGVAIARSDVIPGDLLFFRHAGGNRISHVSMYVGDGRMLHASSTGVRISDFNSVLNVRNFATARRVIFE